MSNLSREEITKEIAELKDEHAALDVRVEAFNAQVWMSPEEQMALKECKKLKLKAKERMTLLQAELDALGEA
ncbi:MAG: DUF465 domain-containing protein [Proteobacteria bacterium]|nr:DUF465 domain-containing protein [Pseudomonadota bacterium]